MKFHPDVTAFALRFFGQFAMLDSMGMFPV